MLAFASVAHAALGATAARRSCIPVVGKWRGSSSTVVLTNSVPHPSRVRLSWIIGSPREFSPAQHELMLHGYETRSIDVASEILHGTEAAGALRIEADAPVGAHAIVTTRANGLPASFPAVPNGDGINTGETAFVGGVSGAGGFRLFVAETRGHPIYFSATAIVGDDERGQRRYYIEPRHQATLAMDRDFGLKTGESVTIILRALNGSGRMVAAAGSITATQDIVPYPMLPPRGSRHRMPWTEVITYGGAGLALIGAAIYSWKNPGLRA